MSTGIIVAVVLLVGFFIVTRVAGGGRISGVDARAKVAAGALLVDVRSPGEFSGGHIDGALNIPHTDIGRRADELGAKDREIVLYCASGMRSGHALRQLRGLGFTAVHNLGPQHAW